MASCRLCRALECRPVIDFGSLAITNQFLPPNQTAAFRQPLGWSECLRCGVVQLADVPPLEQVRCRYPWLTYREPEAHLDQLAAILAVNPDARVLGLSKDDLPLIQRLERTAACVINPVRDLGIEYDSYGMETIQSRWTPTTARQFVADSTPVDLLVARYILEHTHQAADFLDACRSVLASDGRLVIEVPDSAAGFRDLDVTMLWEEHVLYFTEASLRRSLELAGFEKLQLIRIPDPMEDRLVWIGRVRRNGPVEAAACAISDPVVQQFAQRWPQRREQIRAWMTNVVTHGGKLALFGAGHRGCTFLDATGTAELIDCVIDDTPEKQALRFPAGALPIMGSHSLNERGITHCLLAVNPAVEDRIIERNRAYQDRGGKFVSCYPTSTRALR